MKGRNEGNTRLSINYYFQKLDELVKNGNCSYPNRERRWHGVARRSAVGRPVGKNNNITWQSTQRNVRDPSVYLFVNEGNETGNLVFGLCFPMASLDVDGPHLETGESENGGEQAGHREGQGCGELGARHAIVG